MTWDPTPWFIGGGAVHSPEVTRTLPYAALGGKEGIIVPGDLKVTALPVPGPQIRVAPGVAAILAKASGGSRQTYIARNPTDDVKDIAPTGSSSRADLIVAQIMDPFMQGESWPQPEDPTAAAYVRTYVVPNVAPNATTVPAGMTGIPLARLNIPASTGTITNSMVTDLRQLVAPRSSTYQQFVRVPGQWDLAASTTVPWPLQTSVDVVVPPWATHATMTGWLTGIKVTGATSGYLYAAVNGKNFNAGFRYDETAANASRSNYVVAGKVELAAIPATPGSTASFSVLGIRSGGTGALRCDSTGSTLLWDITFTEEAV